MGRIAAVARVAGEQRGIAQVFAPAPAIRAHLAGVAEPRHANALPAREPTDAVANDGDAANDLVAGDDRQLGVRQLAVDDMQVGAADAARRNLDHNLAGGRRRHRPLPHHERAAGPLEDHCAHHGHEGLSYSAAGPAGAILGRGIRPMLAIDRRDFLRSSAAVGFSLTAPADLLAQTATSPSPASTWDAGQVRHLLPAVSDTRMLIEASFNTPLMTVPILRVGSTTAHGRMGDTRGEHWHFYVTDLAPGRPYTLSLLDGNRAALCQPWELATLPGAEERPEKFRLLIYSCAGGHEVHKFLATAIRNRLLRRALSFAPDAVIANGDHVYWDLLAPVGGPLLGASPEAIKLAGTFDRSALVLGGDNEGVLKR